ncbi:MAG: hypothetical protein EOM10_14305, partial [Opitutae bacterium]|nr:hypothetical protein [Opitutae bacterium]
ISLFPSRWRDIQSKCSCPDWANPCKHLAAVFYIIATEIDKDPFLLFQMRGLSKQAILDYVHNGGGLVIYHFACAAFPNWPEWNEMIALGGWGGRNEKHGPYARWKDGKIVLDNSPGRGGGHGPMQAFAIDVRVADHPITKGLPPRFAHVEDELYGWLRGPAKNLTVLATAFAPKEKGGADEHEPILFTVKYGEGRVFQNALGHLPEQLKSVAFIATFQRGCEWAATGKVTQEVPADFPGPDKPSVRN